MVRRFDSQQKDPVRSAQKSSATLLSESSADSAQRSSSSAQSHPNMDALPASAADSGQAGQLGHRFQRLAVFTPSKDSARAERAASQGLQGPSGPLPHLQTIQKSFGHHDVSKVQAHQDEAARGAAKSLGALAYTAGKDVAFAEEPSLHTAAHEAAHVVQQRAGVQLKGRFGEEGDPYERHADAVAERVVRGESAESLLDAQVSTQRSEGGRPSPQQPGLQFKLDKKSKEFVDSAESLIKNLNTSTQIKIAITKKALEIHDDSKDEDIMIAISKFQSFVSLQFGNFAAAKAKQDELTAPLPAFDLEGYAKDYEKRGATESAVVAVIPHIGESETAKTSVALFQYVDQNAKLLAEIIADGFQKVDADQALDRGRVLLDAKKDDLAIRDAKFYHKNALLVELGNAINSKVGKGLWSGIDRDDIIFGDSSEQYFKQGIVKLKEKASEAIAFDEKAQNAKTLKKLLNDWSIGLEAKAYGRRLDCIKDMKVPEINAGIAREELANQVAEEARRGAQNPNIGGTIKIPGGFIMNNFKTLPKDLYYAMNDEKEEVVAKAVEDAQKLAPLPATASAKFPISGTFRFISFDGAFVVMQRVT